MRFGFKTHNFYYGYAYRLHYSGVFEVENGDFWKRCRPRFSLKTPGLCFSVNGPKRRLLKTMAWRPTFALRILDDRVNNNNMLIVVPIDMYRWIPIRPLQARRCVRHLNNRGIYLYISMVVPAWIVTNGPNAVRSDPQWLVYDHCVIKRIFWVKLL